MPEPNDPNNNAPEEPKFVTLEQVTALLKSRDDKLLSKLGAENGKVLARLEELVKSQENPAPAAAPQEPTTKARPEESPEYKGLAKRMAEAEAKMKAAEERAAAEAERARQSKMRQTLSESLSAAGVDMKMLKHAVGFLVDVEKRVKANEDGSVVFIDGNEEVDFATGLRAWLQGDDAKVYLAARGTQGSGDRPHTKATPRQTQAAALSREEVAVALLQALTPGHGFSVG